MSDIIDLYKFQDILKEISESTSDERVIRICEDFWLDIEDKIVEYEKGD